MSTKSVGALPILACCKQGGSEQEGVQSQKQRRCMREGRQRSGLNPEDGGVSGRRGYERYTEGSGSVALSLRRH